MSKQYDVVIVGGGHNGLTAAAYLAKSGKKVLVLEAKPILGGAAVTEEINPGFKYSTCAYVSSCLSESAVSDLDLAKHGLKVTPFAGSFMPLPDGRSLFLWKDDEAKTQEEIAKFSKKDAERLSEYAALIGRLQNFVWPILESPPPDVTETNFSTMWEMLAPALRFRRLSKKDMYELMRITTMSAEDYLGEWFESDVVKTSLGTSIIVSVVGPKSPGSAYLLLHTNWGGKWSGLPHGGMGGVSDAIASAARSFGAEIRTEAPVAKIRVQNGAATGVVLESGEEISARAVISGTDVKRTFNKLVDSSHLEPKFLWHVRNFKMNGFSAKVNLSLSELPDFTCRPGKEPAPHHRGDIVISGSFEYMERAFDNAKYGRFPKAPVLDVVIPSTTDPTLAPKGKHVMSIYAHYVPYGLKEGKWEDRREELGDVVVDTLAKYAPNIKSAILHRHVLTPVDIEKEYLITRGDNELGAITLDQLMFLRPVPGYARYRMPIDKLYLCSGSTHPGGGVMCISGRNAAKEILKDFKSGSI